MTREKLIVILGPTAVGKTQLAIDLARQLATGIISGDSMLVYRGFDIGAAKPSLAERQGIPHELIDILEPTARFSVTDFQELAAAAIHRSNAAGHIPVLAGGTGLYVKSLLEGYCFNETPGDPAYRAELERLAAEKGKAFVHAMLATVEPAVAARLHVNDFRRVIRALEVHHLGGEHISEEREAAGELVYDACVIGLRRERCSCTHGSMPGWSRCLQPAWYRRCRGCWQQGFPAVRRLCRGLATRKRRLFSREK